VVGSPGVTRAVRPLRDYSSLRLVSEAAAYTRNTYSVIVRTHVSHLVKMVDGRPRRRINRGLGLGLGQRGKYLPFGDSHGALGSIPFKSTWVLSTVSTLSPADIAHASSAKVQKKWYVMALDGLPN